jgi:hypothetical protein
MTSNNGSYYFKRWAFMQTLISLALWGLALWGLTTVLWMCSHELLASNVITYAS